MWTMKDMTQIGPSQANVPWVPCCHKGHSKMCLSTSWNAILAESSWLCADKYLPWGGRSWEMAQTTISKENRVDYQHRYCTLSLSLFLAPAFSVPFYLSLLRISWEELWLRGGPDLMLFFGERNRHGRERFPVAAGLRHNAKYLREQFILALEVTIVLMGTQTPWTRPNEGWLIKFLIPKSVF